MTPSVGSDRDSFMKKKLDLWKLDSDRRAHGLSCRGLFLIDFWKLESYLHNRDLFYGAKSDELTLVQIPHEDPLVVCLIVAECLVRRVLIDLGSSANVIPRITFDWLEIKPEKLKPTGNPLLGFNGEQVEPISMVKLPVRAAERDLIESFVVVEIHPFYNLLIGRGWIHRVQGVSSILHQVMRCLSPDWSKVTDIHGDQIDPHRPNRTTRVGSGLAKKEKQQLVDFLSQNADVFAWSHSDMPGINPSIFCHSLNVDPSAKPVRQKQRRFTPERNQIIADEINRLLEAGFIREVQ
ncbi:uncharacterized protein LOC132309568 [Cornus florida]|uniref:uncharacterized protein LOC132309568 n=1 Tax=Cornus florida TaxID=4283 RepID=UPI00289E4881|nr:uncharacterized protein LOC132309568 [Cornus florida]